LTCSTGNTRFRSNTLTVKEIEMKLVNRIRILPGDTGQHRIYAVTRKLLNVFREEGYTYHTPIPREQWKNHRGYEVPEQSFSAIEKLLKTPGINWVAVKPNSIVVHKGLAWDWSELQPVILSILQDEYFDEAYATVEVDDTIAARTNAKPTETSTTKPVVKRT
jgi:hypothetical protein